ncbi:unnamed protein product, partial [Amoebophrya sp. A25]
KNQKVKEIWLGIHDPNDQEECSSSSEESGSSEETGSGGEGDSDRDSDSDDGPKPAPATSALTKARNSTAAPPGKRSSHVLGGLSVPPAGKSPSSNTSSSKKKKGAKKRRRALRLAHYMTVVSPKSMNMDRLQMRGRSGSTRRRRSS